MEFLGKYAAEIIALCALLFTAWNVYTQRKHNILSVTPHLTRFVTSDQNGEVGVAKLELMNNGLGPAFIEKFQIYLNNEFCEYDAALDFVTKGMDCKWHRTRLGAGYAMKAGEAKDLFSVAFPCKNNEELAATREKFNALDVAIEYKCAYGKIKKFDTFDKQD
ncbi:MAG: hypothetical protein AB9Q20_14775 [Candidatus Reddybacter sp.]